MEHVPFPVSRLKGDLIASYFKVAAYTAAIMPEFQRLEKEKEIA